MKSYYCDTATGEVFEADAGQRRAGLMVRQGDDWVESLTFTEQPKAVTVPAPVGVPAPVAVKAEPKEETQPMWLWELVGWVLLLGGGASLVIGKWMGGVPIAAGGATILMACHAVQEICKAIREGRGKAKE